MRRKVYNPKPPVETTGRIDVDLWVHEYESNPEFDLKSVYESEEWQILEDFGLLASGKIILEAGCGCGKWIKPLYDKGELIYGIDFCLTGLNIVRRKMPDAAIVQGDVKYLPYGNKRFDIILSWGVIEHFFEAKDISLALHEAHRCLTNQGYLLIWVPYLS